MPKIGKHTTKSRYARANHISLKEAELELPNEHIQISKQYWMHTSDYEMIRGTPLEKLVRLKPRRARILRDTLYNFWGNPTKENLRGCVGRQGFRDLEACGVLVPYRRFSVARLIYFYPVDSDFLFFARRIISEDDFIPYWKRCLRLSLGNGHLSAKRRNWITHMLIKVLTYADNADDALAEARIIANQLAGEYMPFLYWEDFEAAPGRNLRGNMPAILQVSTARYPVANKCGLEMVREAMDCTRLNMMKLLQTIRYNLDRYTNDEIFNNVRGIGPVKVHGNEIDDGPAALRVACCALGESYGTSIYLYGPCGEGVMDPGHLENILDHRPGPLDDSESVEVIDQPLWVVPFDMQY
jgi:hypothetical protein